jgi:hypothetical protein
MTPINQNKALDERHLPGLCEEASTCGFDSLYPLFREAQERGVWVRRLDGQLVPFRHTMTQRDMDGDIQSWHFMYQHHALTIFND